jgi:hypothetical protein
LAATRNQFGSEKTGQQQLHESFSAACVAHAAKTFIAVGFHHSTPP